MTAQAPARLRSGPPDDRFDFLAGAAGRLGAALVPLAGRPEALPGRLLVETGGTELLLAPLRRATPGVADRVLISHWSRYLFLLVIPPVLLTLLFSDRRLPLRPEETGLVVNGAGLPVAVGLPHAGAPAAPAGTLPERLMPLFRDYLAPVVEGLAAGGRLAPRILWGNVAHYLDWVGRNLGEEAPPGLADAFASLLAQPEWPGGRNPVAGLIRREPGTDAPRRSVCCLLHALPDRSPCRGCPLSRRVADPR